jgi:hypothetical protein
MNIALIGPMHSGKTTLATMLEKEYGYTRVGLADGVKDWGIALLNNFLAWNQGEFPDRWDGMRGKQIIIPLDRQEIEAGKSVFRPFLQWLGTDFVRNYLKAPLFWVDGFREYVEALPEQPVVCDDVRFPNEATALKEMGFTLIRLNRPEKDRHASISNSGGDLERTLCHPSETEHQSIACDETHSVRSLDDLAAIAADIGTRWCVAS